MRVLKYLLKRAAGQLGIFPCIAAIGIAVSGTTAQAQDVPPGIGLTNPTLAFGLSGISDWSTEMPFIDITKTMRPWVGHDKNAWGAMTQQQLQARGYLDAHGWLIKMPPGLTSVGTIWVWGKGGAGDPAAPSRAGIYVLTYDGAGTIELAGNAKVLGSTRGHIVFVNPTGGTMAFNIMTTDPAGTGDYIRNISVVRQKYEALYQAGEIFNPDWLSVISDARELRFMDWMNTNANVDVANWANRAQVADTNWAGEKGVPVEIMVQLANQTGADPWFNMPVGATDDYIRQFAAYVRDHLASGLVAHVEYSNEAWNAAFRAYHWLAQQSQAAWGVSAPNDYYVMRAAQIMRIWDQIFGDQAKTRVDAILATQTTNIWLTQHNLEAPIWKQHDPSGYAPPSKIFDSLAVTTYFGGAFISDPTLRAKLVAQIKTSPDEAKADMVQQLNDPKVLGSLPWLVDILKKNKDLARKHGLKLVAYEGGQTVLQAFQIRGLTKEQLEVTTPFLSDFIRSSEMATIYGEVWDAWAQVGDGPFMQFTDISAQTKFGSWGLLSALGDTNPRAKLVFARNRTAKPWFGNGGGPQYLQGVIQAADDKGETLTGTMKDDFLVGGAGDDVLVPGAGNDGINGGGGTNTLVLTGKSADYRMVPEGAGYRLTGPAVSDYVLNVQKFRFDDGTRTLNQMLNP